MAFNKGPTKPYTESNCIFAILQRIIQTLANVLHPKQMNLAHANVSREWAPF